MRLDELRKELNPRQKELRESLTHGNDAEEAKRQFLELHGILHSKRVAPESPWSYEDMLLNELDERVYRMIPAGEEHSLIWIIWHLSRIEDLTMNLLVAGRDQVFECEGWLQKTKSPIRHTGNGTGLDVARVLSEAVDIAALREYRFAVGRATREVVQGLTLEDFKRKPAPKQLQRIMDEGAVLEVGKDVVDYWSSRDVAGLLLMPPTRHTMIHWNEARKLIELNQRGHLPR
jgi:hypothetical protein